MGCQWEQLPISFLLCSPFSNLVCVKILCVGQEQLLETPVQQRILVDGVELLPSSDCEDGQY